MRYLVTTTAEMKIRSAPKAPDTCMFVPHSFIKKGNKTRKPVDNFQLKVADLMNITEKMLCG